MTIEAVLLTGGASLRMGQDKSQISIGGITLADRIAQSFAAREIPLTVLGRLPIEGARFLMDAEDYAGPLSALARFHPSADSVFITACDHPYFDARLVQILADRLRTSTLDAVVPVREGYRQPLMALYRATAFESLRSLHAEGKRSLMAWLDRIAVLEIPVEAILNEGIPGRSLASVNTPEELAALLLAE